MDKQTSEEKLLRLIDGVDTVNQIKPLPKIGIKPGKKRLKPLPLLFNFIKRSRLNLSTLNRGVLFISGLLTLFLFYSFINGAGRINLDLNLAQPEESSAISKLIIQPKERFLDRQEYLNEVKKRNVFLSVEQESKAQVKLAGPDISELIKDLKLVGIIWSSNPEAMIENTKESRTYILRKTETFGAAAFKVKEILRNSIVLELSTPEGPKEAELR